MEWSGRRTITRSPGCQGCGGLAGMSGIRNRSLALAVPLDREPLDQLGRVAGPRRILNVGVVVRAVLQPPDEPPGARMPKSQSASLGTLLGDECVELPSGLDPLDPVAVGEAPANRLDRVVSHARHLPLVAPEPLSRTEGVHPS